jgi:hypothetical protein
MQAGLVCKDSAADAWEVIRRMGGDRIKEATADKLCRDFTDLQFKPGECVEDFAMCATTIVNQLQDVSDKITDKEVIKKILHTPSPSNSNKWQSRLRHYLISMPCQLRSPLDTCAVVEERKKKPTSGAKEGRLLLTEEEWMAYLKAGEGELSSGGRGGRGHGRGRCIGHDGRGRGSLADSNEEYPRRPRPTNICHACCKLGHWTKK